MKECGIHFAYFELMPLKEKRLECTRQRVTRGILLYLIEYPDAKDTMKGILKWWMPRGYLERGGKEIQQALDYLVLKGWLTTCPKVLQKDLIIYGVNKKRLEQIKAFLCGPDDIEEIKNCGIGQ